MKQSIKRRNTKTTILSVDYTELQILERGLQRIQHYDIQHVIDKWSKLLKKVEKAKIELSNRQLKEMLKIYNK